MEARIVIQGKNDGPQLADLKQPVIDYTHVDGIIFCLVEEGMKSGEPSVIIAIEGEYGSVGLQTSLDKFLTAAVGMIAAAETRWGWKRPEGYSTLIPPLDRDSRKAMLEGIKKELEAWGWAEDEIDKEMNNGDQTD